MLAQTRGEGSRRACQSALKCLVLALVAWVLGACTTGNARPPGATSPSEAIAPLHIGSTTMAELKAGSKAFQLGLADDGTLTFPEYDRLVHTDLQCLKDGGDEVDGLMLTAAHTYYFVVGTPPGGDRSVVTTCSEKYWYPLAPLWSLRHEPPASLIREADDALGQCLREHGVDFPYEHPSVDDFHTITRSGQPPPSAFLACSQAVSAQFKLPNFAGG